MANTFLTPDIIARESLMILSNQLVAANLVHRDYEREFTAAKVGDTINLRRPATFETKEFTGSIVTQDAQESNIQVQLTKHFDISATVTSKEMTLDLNSFSTQIILPAMVSFAQRIDNFVLNSVKAVREVVGSSAPDTLAELAAIDQRLNELRIPPQNRNAIISPATKAAMMSVDAVVHADKRGDEGTALREASVGRIMGLNWWMAQGVVQGTQDAFPAAPVVAPAVAANIAVGDTAFQVDTAADFLIGDKITIAGGSEVYRVENVNYSTNRVYVYQAFTRVIASTAAVTISRPAAYTGPLNVAGDLKGIALCVVPLDMPMEDGRGAMMSYQGLSIRVVFGYDMTTKKNVISFDALAGVKVYQPERMVIVSG